MPEIIKDCFWTRQYKGYYIHGHCERVKGELLGWEVITVCDPETLATRRVPSLHAAKIFITKQERQSASSQN